MMLGSKVDSKLRSNVAIRSIIVYTMVEGGVVVTTWSSKLYMDKIVQKHPHRYRRRFEKQGKQRGFCVALSDKPENSLEIYSARTPWFWYQQAKGIHIVGLAFTYRSALRLVTQIIMDVQRESNEISSAGIREYFQSREQDNTR